MQEHLAHVDGVMLGRAAYQEPALLLDVDPRTVRRPAPLGDCFAAIDAYLPYVEARLAEGVRLSRYDAAYARPLRRRAGARAYRRRLAPEAVQPGAGVEVLLSAVEELRTAGERRELRQTG